LITFLFLRLFSVIFVHNFKIIVMKEKSELQIRVESLLKEKHLTKVALADALGIPKQNVDRVFATQRMGQMSVVADFLGISLDDLLGTRDQQILSHQVDGFVEVDGVIYRIKSKDDIINVLNVLDDEKL